MRSVALGFGFLLIGLVAACGGKMVTSSSGDEGDDDSAEPGTSDADQGQSGKGDDFDADTELGECKLGPLSWETNDGCAWLADTRCYQTREMACNCACPRERDSQCSSGFDAGPNGRVAVDCY